MSGIGGGAPPPGIKDNRNKQHSLRDRREAYRARRQAQRAEAQARQEGDTLERAHLPHQRSGETSARDLGRNPAVPHRAGTPSDPRNMPEQISIDRARGLIGNMALPGEDPVPVLSDRKFERLNQQFDLIVSMLGPTPDRNGVLQFIDRIQLNSRDLIIAQPQLRERLQELLGDNTLITCAHLLQGNFRWANPGEDSTLLRYLNAERDNPDQTRPPTDAYMNCWESATLALLWSGHIDVDTAHAWIASQNTETIWKALGHESAEVLPEDTSTLPAGHLVFFYDAKDPLPDHVGLSLGEGQMLHMAGMPGRFEIIALEDYLASKPKVVAARTCLPPRPEY